MGIIGSSRYGRSGRGDETLKKLDFVEGGFCISRGRFYDFECYMTIHSIGDR